MKFLPCLHFHYPFSEHVFFFFLFEIVVDECWLKVYGWVSRWGIPVGSCRRWWERSNANRPQEGWWWLRLGPAWWMRMSASGWWVGFLMILMLYFDVLWFNLMFYIFIYFFMMFYVFISYQILDICLVFWCFKHPTWSISIHVQKYRVDLEVEGLIVLMHC